MPQQDQTNAARRAVEPYQFDLLNSSNSTLLDFDRGSFRDALALLLEHSTKLSKERARQLNR